MGRTIDSLKAELAEKIAKQASELFLERVWDAGLADESPIEQMMACALQFCIEHIEYFGGHGGQMELMPLLPVGSFETIPSKFPVDYGFHIIPQFQIGRYRADFFVDFTAWRGKRVFGVIECDGHDYHERTKAQAERDKKRDRYFQSLGITVLRYTGTEIHRNPVKCAFEALQTLERLSDPKLKR